CVAVLRSSLVELVAVFVFGAGAPPGALLLAAPPPAVAPLAAAAPPPAAAAPPLAPPIVTRGAIFLTVGFDTPAPFSAFATSVPAYGRPAMIFFAVASPTPGNASNSAWLAAFRSRSLAAVLGLVWACVWTLGRASKSPKTTDHT